MSCFHKKRNVTKCLGHHYAIWTSDSNCLLAQKKLFGPAKGTDNDLSNHDDDSKTSGVTISTVAEHNPGIVVF
jgi:glycyl-tRNA synthetase (class II)